MQTLQAAKPQSQSESRGFAPRRGLVVFDRVTLWPVEHRAPICRGFTLVAAPGERVALTGGPNSGLERFASLLQRPQALQEGRILIDGRDAATLAVEDLDASASRICMAPALHGPTPRDAIANGRLVDEGRLVAAAERAGAHAFVAALPQGYDTPIGTNGVRLLPAERRRLAIARAFLSDAPLLLVDEGETGIPDPALDELMADRTCFVLARTPRTLREADRILVFDGGRLVEDGDHAELTWQGGVYAQLQKSFEAAA